MKAVSEHEVQEALAMCEEVLRALPDFTHLPDAVLAQARGLTRTYVSQVHHNLYKWWKTARDLLRTHPHLVDTADITCNYHKLRTWAESIRAGQLVPLA